LYFIAVLILVGGMLGLSYVLGERHKAPQKGEPYESGIAPTGSARSRWSVKFYQVAMFFVVFDLEAVFLFAWAVAARALGWPGYVEALIFVAVLLVGLVYLWRLGALDWGPSRHRQPLAREQRTPRAAPQPGTRRAPGRTEGPRPDVAPAMFEAGGRDKSK